MEFARRRPMLSAPFGALLGAAVAVALLLPCHCEDLHCLDYTTLDGRFIDGFKDNKPKVVNCATAFEEDRKEDPELLNPYDTCGVNVCQHKEGKHTCVIQFCLVERIMSAVCNGEDMLSFIKNETKIDGNWQCKCAHSKTNQGRDIDFAALGLKSEYYPPWYSFAARLRVGELSLIVALLVPMAIVHAVFN
ncbi:hypothetical protein niasHS_014258 [Heterodera schachtii]|uniref:Uncharacterized protein n=1 Tax=Heterodera schachtii TaxID=97005 RepID=A0ABD2IF66_HETSC